MSTVLTELGGFTPVIDVVTEDVGLMTSVVFGLVWRHCQMKDRVCKKSVAELAEMLEVSSRTVRRHLEKLCDKGYIKDTTPDLRNKPHTYIDTGKVKIVGKIEAELSEYRYDKKSQQNTAMTKSHSESDTKSQPLGHKVTATVTESPMNKTGKRSDKTKDTSHPFCGVLTVAIAEICNLNIEYLAHATGRELTRLAELFDKNHVTPAQVKEFEGWRRIHHWSGKTAPTIKQVGELWGQYEAWVKMGKPGLDAAKNGIPTPPTKPPVNTEQYERLRAEDEAQIYDPLKEEVHAS